MVFYLRNEKRENLVDIEVNQKDEIVDIHSIVLIAPYSNLLLNSENKEQVIADFEFLSELRGWLWENYVEQVDKAVLSDVVSIIRQTLRDYAQTYDLFVVED